ncbi:MAG: transposase [Thermodesulfobacteriota bacterium]|nr:transposase [Thermodesulfobacteriota bacterium]
MYKYTTYCRFGYSLIIIFTKEFKEDAIKLVLENGYSSSEAERCLGIHPSDISRWIRKFRTEQEDIAEGGVKRRELEDEVRRARKINV